MYVCIYIYNTTPVQGPLHPLPQAGHGPVHQRRRLQPLMAFSSYSSLFKCGLLPEGSSPSFTTAPWATEYCGPRRGSLPFPSDRFSELSDFSAQLLEPFTTPGNENTTSDDALYFTFKKRNINEHRSFLSLDLAESQSMRSVSIKGKEPISNAFESEQVSDSAVVSPTDVHNSCVSHSF